MALTLGHQELEDIVTTAAKNVLDGAIHFPDWAERMMQGAGEQVGWIAERTNQTSNAALEQLHHHAVPIAKLLQEGNRLAAMAWIQQYAVTVENQVRTDNAAIDPNNSEGGVAAPAISTPGRVVGFMELCKHPAAYKDGAAPVLLTVPFVFIFLFFLFTDPSAFLHNFFATLSLVVVGFLVFLGLLIGYAWARKRLRIGAKT